MKVAARVENGRGLSKREETADGGAGDHAEDSGGRMRPVIRILHHGMMIPHLVKRVTLLELEDD